MSQFGTDPTPPMHSDFDTSGEPPAWPKVVGIISIVLGSLGIVCGVCAVGITLGMEAFLHWAANMQAQGPAQPGAPTIPTTPMPPELRPGIASIVAALSQPVTSFILIMAGIMTLRRRASGRSMHITYAALSLFFTILVVVGALMYQSSVSGFISAHPDDPWAKFFKTQGNQMIGGIGSACVYILYPIFVLVWFAALGKRPETNAPAQEPLV